MVAESPPSQGSSKESKNAWYLSTRLCRTPIKTVMKVFRDLKEGSVISLIDGMAVDMIRTCEMELTIVAIFI